MIRSRSTLAVAAALLLAATTASAVPLASGFGSQAFIDTPLHGTTYAARPELGGVVAADVDTPFTLGSLSGYVQNRVVREDGTGTLDFYWRVVLDPSTSGGGIAAERLIDFGYGDLTDADCRTDDLGTVPPGTARLFNPASYPTGAINFLFGGAVAPGDSSQYFFLHTDATQFARTALYDLLDTSDNFTGTFSTFAPAVPEPAPTALLGLGLLTLAGLRARRTRA